MRKSFLWIVLTVPVFFVGVTLFQQDDPVLFRIGLLTVIALGACLARLSSIEEQLDEIEQSLSNVNAELARRALESEAAGDLRFAPPAQRSVRGTVGRDAAEPRPLSSSWMGDSLSSRQSTPQPPEAGRH